MNWIEAGNIRYAPAIVKRNNIIHLEDDAIRVDQRYYSEESPRRWYFVTDVGTHFVLEVVSMAYHSGWDSWDKSGEALRKYMNGEAKVLLQKTLTDFDPDNFNYDWITDGH